ncbi:MAG: FecR domain-containing protein, partial [Dehalococcoidia bacterium]|nr:FecR domain-containing protein [Dehalococcoidia bacterium]
PTATAAPTAVATPVPTAAPTAVAPTATTSPAAGATPSGTPDASAPGGAAPALPTVPTVPPPRDATTTTPTIDRDDCQNFSSDPAMWKALEEHLDELDQESVPVTAVRTCLGLYRSQPWPQGTDGYTLAKPEGENAEAAPKATLQTETALVLKATELGRSVTVQGAVLGKGDTLVTRDQSATVEYSEGTRLEMGPKSAIVMGDPAEKTVVQLRGRLFMDIRSRQWHVRIPQPRGLVAVVTRGTVLTTEARDDGMVWIEVTEGSVDVTSAGQTVTVSAGASIVVDPGAAPPTPAPSATAEKSGGTPVAVYGIVAAVGVIAVAGAVFLVRRRSTSRP